MWESPILPKTHQFWALPVSGLSQTSTPMSDLWFEWIPRMQFVWKFKIPRSRNNISIVVFKLVQTNLTKLAIASHFLLLLLPFLDAWIGGSSSEISKKKWWIFFGNPNNYITDANHQGFMPDLLGIVLTMFAIIGRYMTWLYWRLGAATQ